MNSPLKYAFAFLTTSLMTQSVLADAICSPLKDAKLEQQYDNCVKVVSGGKMKRSSLDALRYTIKYFVANTNGLQDPSCAIAGIRQDDTCVNCANPEWIKKGIENKCSFMINDLKQPWMVKKTVTKKDKHGNKSKKTLWVKDGKRTTGFFVDLCAKGNDKLVSRFYINGAKNSPPYSDTPSENLSTRPSNSSTVGGAFLMNDKLEYNFQPFSEKSKEKYRVLASKIKGELPMNANLLPNGQIDPSFTGVPIIRMVGLNTSNNTTEFDKPFHVSAVGQGLGCAGVAPSTHKIMQKATANGASLYMVYNGQQFEQHGNSCVNDSSDGYAPSSGGVPSSPVTQ